MATLSWSGDAHDAEQVTIEMTVGEARSLPLIESVIFMQELGLKNEWLDLLRIP